MNHFITRRKMLGAALLTGIGGKALAQDVKPLTLVVPAPAGAGMDALARYLASNLRRQNGETVVVENRPGASTSIGTEHVARSAPDGRTVLITGTTSLVTLDLQMPISYAPLKDLRPVAHLATSHLLLVVRADSPIHSVADMERLGKERAGGLNCGAPPGMMLIGVQQLAARVQCNPIPYPGVAPAMAALLGGHLDMLMLEPESVARPHMEAGKLRYIAAADGLDAPSVKGVPRFRATWPGFIGSSSNGAWVPQGTPAAVVADLNKRFNQVLSQPDVREWMHQASQPPAGGTPEAMAELARKSRDEHVALWTRLGLQRRAG